MIRRLLLPLLLLAGSGMALGGCAVVYDDGPGYRRPYGYGYRSYRPSPGRYYAAPSYRSYGYFRRPYRW
jgi:hypothetical protein